MKYTIKSIIYFLFSAFIIRDKKDNNIYISFDDGPHPVNTLKIIKELSKTNAKATFFMVGEEMEKYPDVVHEVINNGHTVGYHSYDHKSLKKISFKMLRCDLIKANILVEKFGIKSKLYRPPYGDLTVVSFVWLILNNWKIIMWSVDSGDSFYGEDKVKMNVHPKNIIKGDILLFHDDYNKTVEILPEILKEFNTSQLNCSALM